MRFEPGAFATDIKWERPGRRDWSQPAIRQPPGDCRNKHAASLFRRKLRKTEARMASGKPGRKWSAKVTETSDALDLEKSIFDSHDPKRIATSLKRSAERSKRRKGTPLQSAMSMLNFYINRAGKNLPATQKRVLERAKDELRGLFGRTSPKRDNSSDRKHARNR
jgi:hypothetical protein